MFGNTLMLPSAWVTIQGLNPIYGDKELVKNRKSMDGMYDDQSVRSSFSLKSLALKVCLKEYFEKLFKVPFALFELAFPVVGEGHKYRYFVYHTMQHIVKHKYSLTLIGNSDHEMNLVLQQVLVLDPINTSP